MLLQKKITESNCSHLKHFLKWCMYFVVPCFEPHTTVWWEGINDQLISRVCCWWWCDCRNNSASSNNPKSHSQYTTSIPVLFSILWFMIPICFCVPFLLKLLPHLVANIQHNLLYGMYHHVLVHITNAFVTNFVLT